MLEKGIRGHILIAKQMGPLHPIYKHDQIFRPDNVNLLYAHGDYYQKCEEFLAPFPIRWPTKYNFLIFVTDEAKMVISIPIENFKRNKRDQIVIS